MKAILKNNVVTLYPETESENRLVADLASYVDLRSDGELTQYKIKINFKGRRWKEENRRRISVNACFVDERPAEHSFDTLIVTMED